MEMPLRGKQVISDAELLNFSESREADQDFAMEQNQDQFDEDESDNISREQPFYLNESKIKS
jgi:hypothetical protein